MLIPLSKWTAVCAIVPSVTAFYPYEPKYGDGSNGKARRAPLANAPSGPSSHQFEPRRSLALPLRRGPVRTRDNKYNIVNNADPKQENSVAIDQDGTDLSYMVAVTIGSSKEEYHLLLDSAASNTWVMGEGCETDACGRHNLFGKGDSDSLKTDTTTFSITYGTGSVSGTTASDTVHVGSLSSTLTFGLATNVSQEFSSYPMDGILGIGRGDTVDGTIEAPQLIEVLSSSKLVSSKLYGVHLSRTSDGINDGELNFGDVNKDRFSGDLNWLSAIQNDNGFWEIAVDDAGADDKTIGVKGRSAIIDTGTSFILMPENDAVAVHKLIDGFTQSGETFTVPCDTKKAMQIKIGSTTYDISTADWIGGKLDTGACKSNIIGRQTFGENQWLVGDVFLKNVYTVFDFDNTKVGFGVKDGSSNGETSASASATPSATASTGESSSPTPTSSSSEATTTADPLIPAGSSGTGLTPAATSGSSNPSAAAEASPSSSQAGKGDGGRVGVPASTFALSIALGLLSIFT